MPNLWNIDRLLPGPDRVVPGDTLPAMFWHAVAARGERTWLRQKEFGLWRSWSWNHTATAVREIAHGLMALDFQRGQTASILSNTVVEWVLADLAVLSCGGVSSGIYPTDSAAQVHYLCDDSRTTVLFVEDDEQLDKALQASEQLPLLRRIVVFDMEGLADFDDPLVMSLDALRASGRDHLAQHPRALEARVAAVQPEDLAILVYTSGTTGRPKGAMHLHRGLTFWLRQVNLIVGQDRIRRAHVLSAAVSRGRAHGRRVLRHVHRGEAQLRREPRHGARERARDLAHRVHRGAAGVGEVLLGGDDRGARGLAGAATGLSLGTAGRPPGGRARGARAGGARWLKAKFMLGRWLALDNVRKLVGIHRARFLLTGAAPISPDLIRWYLALGVPMFEVWGMTETAGLSTSMQGSRIKPGSIGKAASFNEVRIDAASGEILVRGRNVFAGYLNQPQKTAETIDADGWLHTGDVGTVDDDGYFRITDRMKDIIITAGGKNVTPSEWENELKFSPYVTDAVVIGDKRPYLTALVMIDQENVERYAQERDIPFSNYASLTRAAEVRALIQRRDRQGEQEVRPRRADQAFHLLETQLTAEDEELTPTMKLKRKLVHAKYAPQIEAMYQ